MKLKNGVRLREEFRQGYGGPDTWYLYVEWDNRLLLEETTASQRELGALAERLRRRYGGLSTGELRTRAESAKLAHPICERCGKPCDNGCVSKGVTSAVSSDRRRAGKPGNPTWCSRCDKEEPGVIGVVFRDNTRVIVNDQIAHRPTLRGRHDNSDVRVPGATGRVVGLGRQFVDDDHRGQETYFVRYEQPLMAGGLFTADELQTIPESPGDD